MFKRHDMLYISKAGRKKILESVSEAEKAENPIIEELVLDEKVPAIVSRQENPEKGLIQVGFAHYKKEDGRRFRTGVVLEKKYVEKIITPFDAFQAGLVQENFRMAQVLKRLQKISEEKGISCGLYGSSALEVLTAYLYTDHKSDVDIFIKKRDNTSHILEFYHELIRAEEFFDISIDCEVEAFGDYGIKLKELFSPQKTVLAKGFLEAKIFYKEELSEFLREINEYKGRVE